MQNLEFACIDAANYTSEPKYDLAISFSAFHWIEQQAKTIKNMYNALKSGGHLIIKMGCLHKNPIADVYKQVKWAPFFVGKKQTYFPKKVDEMHRMLEDSGFKNIEVTKTIAAREFHDKQELFNWAFAWVPHSTGFPDDKAREFTQDLVESVCFSRTDGQIILESAFLEATATKP